MRYRESSDGSFGYAKAISSRDGIQRKDGKLIRISCIDAYKCDVASINNHTVFFSGRGEMPVPCGSFLDCQPPKER